MFERPLITKDEVMSKQYFVFMLGKFAQQTISPAVIKEYLQKISVYNKNFPTLLVCILDILLANIFTYPHIYDFCQKEVPDDYWQVMLSRMQILPQPGLTRFALTMGILLNNKTLEKPEKLDDPIIISAFKKAIEDYQSFPAYLMLHEFSYRRQLQNAINYGKDIVDIEKISREILQHGEIHGTPTYILRASFCVLGAQYCHRVTNNTFLAITYYQLAIQYFICADKIKNLSMAAINNAIYVYNVYPQWKQIYGKLGFFNLLNQVKEGNVEILINEIKSISKLKSPEIDIAHNYGLVDAEKFALWLNNQKGASADTFTDFASSPPSSLGASP